MSLDMVIGREGGRGRGGSRRERKRMPVAVAQTNGNTTPSLHVISMSYLRMADGVIKVHLQHFYESLQIADWI